VEQQNISLPKFFCNYGISGLGLTVKL